MRRITSLLVLGLTVAVTASAMLAREDGPLRLVRTIALPGVQGRFDHFACDPDGQRVFVAALGNNTVEVIALADFTRAGSISGIRKPTGIAFLGSPDRIGVAAGEDGLFRTFDAKTFAPLGQIDGLDDADNVRRDAPGLVYVGFGDGALAVIDAGRLALLGEIKLPGHPESFQLEPSGPRIFVNVPDAKRVVVVDREQRRIVAEWPMTRWQANFPMALDATRHRLFVGCRRPARLVVINTDDGTTVGDFELSGDVDDLFFDATRSRLYASCGEGFVDTIACAGDRYERLARQPTRSGARTCFYSPELDRLFLALPARGGVDAELRVYQPQ